jgi:glutaconate CoA-transferase subunit A
VAVFHALKADRWGNAFTAGLRDDLMMARASRRVIVTAEEIVDHELTLEDALHNTFLPAIDVDGVVAALFGAHPCGCGLSYPVDELHVKEYLEHLPGLPGKSRFHCERPSGIFTAGGFDRDRLVSYE